VLSFSIEAAKNSKNRRDARAPASAIIAGTTKELETVGAVTGAPCFTTAGTLDLSALIATPKNTATDPRIEDSPGSRLSLT
jgi:hypothetical protein